MDVPVNKHVSIQNQMFGPITGVDVGERAGRLRGAFIMTLLREHGRQAEYEFFCSIADRFDLRPHLTNNLIVLADAQIDEDLPPG